VIQFTEYLVEKQRLTTIKVEIESYTPLKPLTYLSLTTFLEQWMKKRLQQWF
jgi:hypothetical protein